MLHCMWEAAWRRSTVSVSGGMLLMLGLAFVAFSGLDCVTTTYGVLHGAIELNPFESALLSHGLEAFFVLRAAVVTLVLAALQLMPRRAAGWVALLFTAVTAAAVVANFHTILR